MHLSAQVDSRGYEMLEEHFSPALLAEGRQMPDPHPHHG